MQNLALLAVQNMLRDAFQTIMNVLFVLNSVLPLETNGIQMFMFPEQKLSDPSDHNFLSICAEDPISRWSKKHWHIKGT